MKLDFLLGILLSIPAISLGQGFEPDIEKLAKDYRSKILKLAEKRDAATRSAQDAYLATLESAEQDAVAAKDGKLAEAIQKEVSFVKLDAFASTEGFPRKLITSRKALERVTKQAEADAEKEAKRIGASYLSELNRIPVGQGATEKLIKEIASEKQALLSVTVGPVLNTQTDLVGTRWWNIEKPEEICTFSKEGLMMDTWRFSAPEPDEVIFHWSSDSGTHLKLAKNGRMLLNNGEPYRVLITDPEK